MDLIPVIDVRHGLVVRADRGQRAAYRPLSTPLAQGSDPGAVALGLRRLFAFPVLYVADLDGIEGRGRNGALPGLLAAALPDVELWIDDGASPRQVAARLGSPATPVVGTESMRCAEDLAALRTLPPDRYVLSLDFDDAGLVGPADILVDAAYWPDRVIVMTLARVGSGQGPDLERVAEVVRLAAARRTYAAGGVRGPSDIEALRRIGAAGVLVASALHAGTLTAGDLEAIAGR